jgi:hypothetical protein
MNQIQKIQHKLKLMRSTCKIKLNMTNVRENKRFDLYIKRSFIAGIREQAARFRATDI